MQTPGETDLYAAMQEAISGEGVQETYLLETSYEAEQNRLMLIGLQRYVREVVAKSP